MRHQTIFLDIHTLCTTRIRKSILGALLTLMLLVGVVVPQAAIAETLATVSGVESASYNGTYYYVKHGDSLSVIAARYGVSMRAIMDANGLYNANHVYVGQRLLIPGGKGGYGHGGHTKGACAKVHYVKFGQNLSSIAVYYGISSYALASANGIHNLNHIFVGQRLCIPGHQKPKPHPKPPHQKPHPPQPKPHPKPPHKPPQGDCQHYSVKHGETLAQIANWYGTTVQGIVYANNLPNANHIYVGQPLSIPGKNCHQYPQPQPQPNPNPPHPNPEPTTEPEPTAEPEEPEKPDPAPQGYWLGRYYDNIARDGDPKFTRNDPHIDFKWDDDGPGSDIPGDRFGIHWEQSIYFEAGTYRFYARTDDGIFIYTGDETILEAWRIQPATNYFVDMEMAEGYHTVNVNYYEETGNAEVRVWWEKK